MTGSNDLFCFRPVTCHEVKDAMDKLHSSKAVGYDGWRADTFSNHYLQF